MALTVPRSFRVCGDAKTDFSRDFRMKQQIGSGKYGFVFLCQRESDNEVCAVKRINKRSLATHYKADETFQLAVKCLRNEIATHRLAGAHPNVATLYDVYEDDTTLYLVMEYCSGGELLELMMAEGCLKEAKAAQITKQLCIVLKFLHEECGIVHCDIKPDNVLLASKESLQIKLVDFGFAKVLSPGEFLTRMGCTPHYTAPEVIRTGDREPLFAHPSDMWSLGVIVFMMLFNFPPFAVESAKFKGNQRKEHKAVYRKILRGFYPVLRSAEECGYGPWFPDSTPSSEGVRDIISSLLQKDVCKRLTAAQVLEHAWFGEVATDCNMDHSPEFSLSSSSLMSENSSSEFTADTSGISSSFLPDLGKDSLAAIECDDSKQLEKETTLAKPSPDEIEKQLIKEMLFAVAKLSRGCFFREAVAKLYIDEFRSERPDLYATIVRCFDSMATLGVVDLHSFGCFVAHWGPGHVCAKHVTAMYRELALPAMGEDHADGFRLADIVTAAVIDYIGASQKRLQRVFDELADSNGLVSVDAVVRRLEASDPHGDDWDLVACVIEAQRVEERPSHAEGMDLIEFLAFMDPRYEETPDWAHYFF